MEETLKNVYCQKMEIISEANRVNTQMKYKSNLWSTAGSNKIISNFKNSNLNDSRIYGRKHGSNESAFKDQSTTRSPLKDIRNSKRKICGRTYPPHISLGAGVVVLSARFKNVVY